MHVVYKDDPRTLVVLSNGQALGFRLLPPSPSSDRPIVAVEILPASQITRENGYRPMLRREIHGCLGLIEINKQQFLGVITKAVPQIARPVSGQSVERIFGVEFLSLSNDDWDFMVTQDHDHDEESLAAGNNPANLMMHPCEDLRKLLSNGSFYFSNDFDLTSLLQNRGVEEYQGAATINYQREYMWNSFMMEELFKFRSNLESFAQEMLDSSRIFTSVIRGFAKTVNISANDTFTIISKQSWKRAGTRYNSRGIDDDGNVANFVESEFIFNNKSKGQIFAYNQVRGSVPTFWEQDSTLINPKITLTRSTGATLPIFNKHFAELCSNYGVVHVVNLLSKTKPAEVALSKRYLELYNSSSHLEDTSFTEFDFHSETKSQGFGAATKILPLVEHSLEDFGWFTYDMQEKKIVTRQNGVFRTNCLDCLDRTNLIQQVLSREILQHILASLGARGPKLQELLTTHNDLWADNGDAISQIYTGTNALKSSFSRSGKMSLAGALSDVTKSVSRMYQNSFVDSKKQSLIDVLLGYDAGSKSVKIYDPVYEAVHNKLITRSSEYLTSKKVSIFVGTFNVNATAANPNFDLRSWLFPPENAGQDMPEIYAIGLQELIELNAGSILQADGSKAAQWTKIFESQINSQGKEYLLLRTESIASMMLLLFVRKDCVHHIKQVAGSSKKTGLGGIAANKGGCAVRFEYGSTSIALVTSHLAAGHTAVTERYNDYQTIMQGLTFTRNYTLKDHEHVFWFGDLNYRIALQNDQCRHLVEFGAFDELIAVDQLRQEMSSGGAFSSFKEAPIKFYPTYKFDKGTSNYDSSEKQRVPSWTDRVVYKAKKNWFKQLNYNSVMDIVVSDHKPVFATFRGEVQFVNEDKKKAIMDDLYKQYKGQTNEVSLLEDFGSELSSAVDSSNPTSRPRTVSPSFSTEAFQELNLMDADLGHVPPLPSRVGPRRVPPPPEPRKTKLEAESRKDMSNSTAVSPSPSPSPQPKPKPQSQSQSQSQYQSQSQSQSQSQPQSQPQPQPPLPRRTTNSSVPPMGFSSTPLIPSRSQQASPANSVSSASTRKGPEKVPPIVPVKPASIKLNKTDSEPATKTVQAPTPVNASAPPPPPPPRNVHAGGSMMDWKPLVPK